MRRSITSLCMPFVSRFTATTIGFTTCLAILIAVLMLVVGLGPDALPFPPHAAFSDAAISHWPNALYLQQSLRAGQIPLWRDLLMSGQPFAANPLNKVWYPLQWLVLILPVTLHLNLLIWGHLVLAGVGMRALGLRLGIGQGASSIMGVAYALTPRLLSAAGAGHLDILYAAAWFPCMLWAVHLAILGTQRIAWRLVAVSVIGAMCFFADIRLSVFVFGTSAVFALWLAYTSRRYTALLWLMPALILMVGLTAIQWLPVIALAPYLTRSTISISDAATLSLQPVQIIGLVIPDRFGSHETMLYVGLIVLILACVGFARAPRRHAFWAILTLAALLYALGDQGLVWPVLVHIIPPLLWLRVPPRVWIVGVVALIVLAGYGLSALADRSLVRSFQRRTLQLIGFGLAIAGVGMGVAAAKFPALGVSIALGFVAAGVLLFVSRRLSTQTLFVLAGIVIILDLAWMDVSLVQGRPQNVWLDQYAPLAQAMHEAGVTRLYSPDYSFPQQAAAYWQIPQFGGIDPFQLRAYVTAFEAATGTYASGYSVTLPAFEGNLATTNQHANIDANLLARWNVSHVLAGFVLDIPGLKLISRPDNLYLYANERYPSGTTKITWDSPNRFTVNNSGDQTINVAAWVPGWNVAAPEDNTEISVSPYGQVSATYSDPPGMVVGAAMSGVSLLIVMGLLASGIVRK
ncbi:MAG: hypothetical protein ABI947_12880 [Chloroflexota bacterium]